MMFIRVPEDAVVDLPKISLRKFLLGAAAGLIAAAPNVAAAQSVLRDAEIEQWLQDYSYPIFRAAGLDAPSVNILIIGDPTPNAFAGGLNMGIHTGLITTADTPNQIEGVIAHEAGHIAGGHTQRTADAISQASTPIILSLILAAGAIAAGSPEAGIGLLGLGQNIALGNFLTYSRGQEATADQAALAYLQATQKSPQGLIEFFGKLRNDQIIRGYKVNPYLQSHPLANERMSTLQTKATASPYVAHKDTPEEIARLNLLQGKINGFLQEPNVTFRQYPLTDQSQEARYARSVAYYRNGDLEKGLAAIDGLIAEKPADPYFYELKGQMLFESGRVEESIAPHAKSVELAPAKALLKINLGRALAAGEDADHLERAVKELRSALLLEPDNAFGWFELARAYGGLGKDSLADLATAESRYYAGKRAEAAQFARRARAKFKEGSPEWRRASDIIGASAGDDSGDRIAPDDDKKTEPEKPQSRRPEVPDPSAH